MVTKESIREDLKGIRYYFSRKEIFDNGSKTVGENEILDKIKKYNEMISKAPPKLYDMYVSLYSQKNTHKSLAESSNYSVEHITRLNTKLVNYFLQQFNKEEQ